MTDTYLFNGGYLDSVLRAQADLAREKVAAISETQLQSLDEERLVQHIVDDLTVEPLVLHEDRREMERNEVQIDVRNYPGRMVFDRGRPVFVPGYDVKVSIPFTGDMSLWHLTPNSQRSILPKAIINEPQRTTIGNLVIHHQQPADQPIEEIKHHVDGVLEGLRFYLRAQKQQVDQFNASLPQVVRPHIQARRERLNVQKGIQQLLGIPLKKRDGQPNLNPIPLTRKLVQPLPAVPQGGYQPEPGITDEQYEHILGVVRHAGLSFEQTPTTYAKHDEEELRDMVLGHLNGHYGGRATGETFRKAGKTDIRLEAENRAAFVAELKVWRGASEMKAAIDQLLSYLTWRDAKTALVIFNKHNAGFTDLIGKVAAGIQAHPNFKRLSGSYAEGEWRCVFTSSQDTAREISIHIFMFNVFV